MVKRDYKIEEWLDEKELGNIEYFSYWNDEEAEKEKSWYVLDGNFHKMEEYLESTNLEQDLYDCLTFLDRSLKRPLRGVGIDLAAGNLWAVPKLINQPNVKKVFCLEMSRHRLEKIGPAVLRHYKVEPEKVVLAVGSFYKLKLPDKSLDFVFMSAAFHHADEPDRLLREVYRVLKTDGSVIILGEHVLQYYKSLFRHTVKYILARLFSRGAQERLLGKIIQVDKFWAGRKDLYPDDPVAGDHYYSLTEYSGMFLRHGFTHFRRRNSGSNFQSFVLTKKQT